MFSRKIPVSHSVGEGRKVCCSPHVLLVGFAGISRQEVVVAEEEEEGGATAEREVCEELCEQSE